ncbi:MAG TPA: hypothetical protein VFN61_03035 [Acidimicrobiales bacterium]|nr:hypothetical protein [Acidimicrobiales bacterium]
MGHPEPFGGATADKTEYVPIRALYRGQGPSGGGLDAGGQIGRTRAQSPQVPGGLLGQSAGPGLTQLLEYQVIAALLASVNRLASTNRRHLENPSLSALGQELPELDLRRRQDAAN